MELENNEKILKDIYGLKYEYAQLFKRIFKQNNIRNCLELGFANGKSTCYMASILKDMGGGHITTIDKRTAKNRNPNIIQLIEKLGLEEFVTYYFERQSYNWRLMKLIEENPKPVFDFCYLDGAHNWYQDGYAFFLIDKLLKPGGLIIFDAFNWSYSKSPTLKNAKFVQKMDEDERSLPQIKLVFELLVKQHPSYEKFEIIDDKFALAYKKKENTHTTNNIKKKFRLQLPFNKEINNDNKEKDLHTQEKISNEEIDTNDFLKSYHYTKLNNQIEKLTEKVNSYENDYNEFKEESNEIFNSTNYLLSTLYLDYELQPKELLNNIQTLCSELLSFVNNISEKYDFKWWLDYGNLLGSQRHQGFIPWDDDMDIGILRKDYHKLIEVLYDEIIENNLDDCISVEYRWRKFKGKALNSHMQLYIKDKPNNGKDVFAGVDVFPYDFLVEYDKTKIGNQYYKGKRGFYTNLLEGTDRTTVYMGVEYEKIIGNLFSQVNLSYEKQKYIIPGVEGASGPNGTNFYDLMIYETEKVFPLKEVKYGQYTFKVPKNPDYWLKQIYGNYMKIPKSARYHARTNRIRTLPNVNKKLEDYIDRFQTVNQNFK